jgi:hypothetical protein
VFATCGERFPVLLLHNEQKLAQRVAVVDLWREKALIIRIQNK